MTNEKTNLDKIRTAMSNERTFLAYLRTALSLAAFGFFILKFFSENQFIINIGILSVLLGAVMFLLGIIIYLQRRKRFSE